MAQVISTMGESSESSKTIADIIGTIDSIAFQTSILAPNATPEAARAGEQVGAAVTQLDQVTRQNAALSE